MERLRGLISAADSAIPQGVSDAHQQIIIGLISILGVVIAGLVYVVKSYANTKTAAEQSTQANTAVNHTGAEEVRIFEQVAAINTKLDSVCKIVEKHDGYWDDFHTKWGRLPSDISDGTGLVVALRDLRSEIVDLRSEFDGHVASS